MSAFDALELMPMNKTVIDNFIRAYSFINRSTYKKIICTISGGSDSDIVLDLCSICDIDKKIEYVWFDTGLEYQATKEHLKYLENKYGVGIVSYKAKKPIPITCKEKGQPFLSKQVSEFIERLQRYDFEWEDKSFDVLMKKYPKCKAALRWWCNEWGNKSRFNINYNKHLKEFMIQNPPTFKISNKCCKYAKKDVIHECLKVGNYDLNIYGVRKSEGGSRASAYKNCFDDNCGSADEYRPIFFYTNSDKRDYEEKRNIVHSKCYTEYGLKRTGCAGCPFGRDFETELNVMKQYEPNLFVAVNNIFKDSYEYTRKYNEFKMSAVLSGSPGRKEKQ